MKRNKQNKKMAAKSRQQNQKQKRSNPQLITTITYVENILRNLNN